MSRIFDGSGSNYLSSVNDIVTTDPVTVACWVKLTSPTANETIWSFKNTASNYIELNMITGVDWRFRSTQEYSAAVAGTTVPPTGTWTPVVCRLKDANPSCFIDTIDDTLSGGFDGAWQTNSSATLQVGLGSGDFWSFDGEIAHLTIWSSDIGDSNVDSFLAGDDPTGIDAANLEAYWAFTSSSLTDSVNSYVLTENGTVSWSTDDPIAGSSIGTLVQSKQNSGGTATITLDSAPTSGNLLIYGTVSGNSGVTLSTPPSGFTEITSHTSADYSSWWGYKISDGTETARSHVWSAGNGYSLYAEYYWQEGTPRVQSNEDTSNVTADGTGPQSSGSVTPDDLTTNLCLAFITSRFQPSSDGSGAFSNSYNADISFAATPTIAGTAIASLANASGSTSSSYSWSDAGIDTYGAIAAFSPPGAGGGLLPLLNAYYS